MDALQQPILRRYLTWQAGDARACKGGASSSYAHIAGLVVGTAVAEARGRGVAGPAVERGTRSTHVAMAVAVATRIVGRRLSGVVTPGEATEWAGRGYRAPCTLRVNL